MPRHDRPNRELVVYALGLLGGEFERVHTEDLAIKCHELFPDSFSWTRHPTIPDKDIVRVALTDARKAKYGALVEGRAGQSLGQHATNRGGRVPDGWILTRKGTEWFKAEGPSIGGYATSRQLRDHRQQALRRLKRVFQHHTWQAYKANPGAFSVSLGELAGLLRCRVDAPEEVWHRRFADLERDAGAGEDDSLVAFLQTCRAQYQEQR